ncbi:hypothetical protein D3C78_1170640 [compost metagenome]
MEGDIFVRIVQKHRFQRRHRAVVKVDFVVIEVQHGVRRIGLAAKTIVGQHPVGTVGHMFDAGMALQRLPVDRQANTGHAIGGFTRHAAQFGHAFAAGVFTALL